MRKTTITKNEYHQLVGLMALAGKKNRELEDIRLAASEIVGDDPTDTGSHTADQIYGSNGDPSADDLLRKLHIVVDPGQ